MGDAVYYQAAGGVVIHDGQVLLLDRPSRGEVRLPKGHVEEGESPAQAALREVTEETGYTQLLIVADLGTQRARFVDPYRERDVTRDEHYFLMRLQDEGQIERKVVEQQFRPIWMSPADAVARLTYETEQEFARRALHWMEQNARPG